MALRARIQGFIVGTLIVLVAGLISGCGKSDNSGDGAGGTPVGPAGNRVDWASIPKEFNPSIQDYPLALGSLEVLSVDLFGAADMDISVHYSAQLRASEGILRLFVVSKGDSGSWQLNNLSPKTAELHLAQTGTYKCQIKITDGRIAELNGGCLMRAEVTLPLGSTIEVYNRNKIISKRFRAMSTQDFLINLDRASFKDDKLKVIDGFLASYAEVGRTPTLTADDMGRALEEFSFDQEKLDVLKRLHTYVADREGLGRVIDEKFSYFEREKARAAIGLPPAKK